MLMTGKNLQVIHLVKGWPID